LNKLKKISHTTHYDTRCTACAVALTTAISLILRGDFQANSNNVAWLTDIATEFGKTKLDTVHHTSFQEHMRAPSLAWIQLDDEKYIGYSLKCIAAAFYSLRNTSSFKQSIIDLILQGGDADTNGAVTGALLGAYYGYSGLPKEWIDQLIHTKWLDVKIDKLLRNLINTG